MRDVLIELSNSESGKRFLVNVWDGLKNRHLKRDSVLEILAALRGSMSWELQKANISRLVYSQPERYQFSGPEISPGSGEWMTIKPMADLLFLLRDGAFNMNRDLLEILSVVDGGAPHTELEDEVYIRFAEKLSDPASSVSFMIAKRFNLRPAPSWYSRWCRCPFRTHFELPSSEASGRFRDWLGLAYGFKLPLFIIRCKRPLSVHEIKAHRPTIWDGFDNYLFKHRTTPDLERDNYGSTSDISKLRRLASNIEDIEGGPELVSRGVIFDPVVFTCDFLGKTPELNYDVLNESYHAILLQKRATMEGVLDEIAGILSLPVGEI